MSDRGPAERPPVAPDLVTSHDLRLHVTGADGDPERALHAIRVIDASEAEVFSPRLVSTSEILEIYEMRLRAGRLDAVTGGRELVAALRALRDAGVLMVVVDSPVGVLGVWATRGWGSVVGTLVFPFAPEVDRSSGLGALRDRADES